MDFRYLKQHVGDALAQGLSDVAIAQPKDPVDHLGKWLLKYIDNQNVLKAAESDKVAIEQGRHAAAELVKQETENKAYKQANEARFISRIPECTEFDTLYATTVATIMSNTNATNVYIALMELGEDDLVWPVIPPDPDTPEGAEGEKPPEPEPPKEEPEEGEEGEEKTADIFQEKPPPEINRNAYLRYVFANDANKFMIDQTLKRIKPKKEPEEGVKLAPGVEGWSFAAIDARGSHLVPNVIAAEPPVQFFDMPMPGSFLASALGSSERLVYGLIGCDTLNGDRFLSADDQAFIQKCVELFETTYEAIVMKRRKQYEEQKAYLASLALEIVEPDEAQVNEEEENADSIESKVGVSLARLHKVQEQIKLKLDKDKIEEIKRTKRATVNVHRVMAAVIYVIKWNRGHKLSPDKMEAEMSGWELVRKAIAWCMYTDVVLHKHYYTGAEGDRRRV